MKLPRLGWIISGIANTKNTTIIKLCGVTKTTLFWLLLEEDCVVFGIEILLWWRIK